MASGPNNLPMNLMQVMAQEKTQERPVDRLLTLRVRKIKHETADIAAFELVDPDGRELPPFTAGAHLDIRINDKLRRQYSLCSDPSDRSRYEVAVLKESGGRGGSVAMHAIPEGAMLTVSEPINRFPLAGREARSHLLLAGGIGVTPMMAMIAELEAQQRPWHMHYCTRSADRSAFLDRLAPYIAAKKVEVHHDNGDPAKGLDIAKALSNFEIGTHLYYCGPAGFMTAAKNAVGAWPTYNVHSEYFEAPDDRPPAESGPFQIKIKSTGQVYDVPADKTIVAVLRENGFDVATECEDGYCGTCITRYLEGEPEHRDTVLSEGERKTYVMVCCARSKSPMLVLDP
jgi:vanillate O-demethylase ferredoxin subunit